MHQDLSDPAPHLGCRPSFIAQRAVLIRRIELRHTRSLPPKHPLTPKLNLGADHS